MHSRYELSQDYLHHLESRALGQHPCNKLRESLAQKSSPYLYFCTHRLEHFWMHETLGTSLRFKKGVNNSGWASCIF